MTLLATTTSTKDNDNMNDNMNDNIINDIESLRVIFLHLDWGIGGAEQLMLQLCHATKHIEYNNNNDETTTTTTSSSSNDDNNHSSNNTTNTNNNNQVKVHLHLITSYCNPNHCFDSLNPTKNGIFYPYLNVWGRFIPSHIYHNKGKAIMSTIRLIYLTLCILHKSALLYQYSDIIILDVLPTPLFLLYYFCPNIATLFYCHYPDQLLIQTQSTQSQSSKSRNSIVSYIIYYYRNILNFIEEQCMMYADTIVVNSKFTQQTVYQTFPKLLIKQSSQQSKQSQQQTNTKQTKDDNTTKDDDDDTNNNNTNIAILYPTLDIPSMNDNDNDTNTTTIIPQQKHRNLIVSLNRYERKKNLHLIIEVIAYIQNHSEYGTLYNTNHHTLQVVIAGGYDSKNLENIQYYNELQNLAKIKNVKIDFQRSISDIERITLLSTATICLYTPENEHFGIVPLEAMYYYTPVIACNNGGPKETILHGTTGFLCNTTPSYIETFSNAILTLLNNPQLVQEMGYNGHNHVLQNFCQLKMDQQWKLLINNTLQKRNIRIEQMKIKQNNNILLKYISPRIRLYIFEGILLLLLFYTIRLFILLIYFFYSTIIISIPKLLLLNNNTSSEL